MQRKTVWILVTAAAAGACGEAGRTAVEPELAVAPLFAHAEGALHGGRNFQAHATGSEEVPPRDTRAQGQAIFQLSHDGTELRYKLIVANIENVTQAHIHLAPRGENGNIVAWLYPSAPPAAPIEGRSQGVLGEGVITDDDLVNDLEGSTVADLVDEIRAGNTYVNVHTERFGPGEIRGQVR